MTLTTINTAKYPDRSYANPDWLKVLPRPEYPLQAAELIEIQSLLQRNLQHGLNTLTENEVILTGLEARELNRTDTELVVSINSGTLLIDGISVAIPAGSISVPLNLSSTIGIAINRLVITEEDDPSLRDPAQGGAAYGDAGAARFVYETTLVVDDASAYNLFLVRDNQIVKAQSSPLRSLERKFEQYIFERNGNFIVEGLEVGLKSAITGTIIEGDNQFTNLITQRDAAEAAFLEYQSQSQALTQQRINLQAELAAARKTLVTDSSNNNQLVVNQLETQLEELTQNLNDTNLILSTNQLTLNNIEDQYLREIGLLSQRFILSVNGGIAYILGKKIAPQNPFIVEIPITNNDLKDITSTLTYRGNEQFYHFELRLVASPTYDWVTTNDLALEITFNNIQINQLLETVTLTARLDAFASLQNPNGVGTNLFNLDQYLTYLAQDIDNAVVINPKIVFSSNSGNYSSAELKQYLKNQVNVAKIYSDRLSFSSELTGNVNPIQVSYRNTKIDANFQPLTTWDYLIQTSGQATLINDLNNQFDLGYKPVVKVNSLIAEQLAEDVPLVRNQVPGTVDELPDDTVIEILKVYQGTTTYVAGVDFQLINQRQIDWSLGGNEPAIGSTYYADFIYTKLFIQDQDYQVVEDAIQFTGDFPLLNGKFHITYQYRPPQVGNLYLTADAQVDYNLSLPDTLTIPSLPVDAIELATFKIAGNEISITQSANYLPSWSEIKEALITLKANYGILNQLLSEYRLQQIAVGENIPAKMRLGAEFRGFIDIDVDHPDFKAAYVPTNNGFTLPATNKDVPLKYLATGSVVDVNEHIYLPYGSVPLQDQLRVTKARILPPALRSQTIGNLIVTPNLVFYNAGNELYSSCDPLVNQSSLVNRSSIFELNQDSKLGFVALGKAVQEGINTGSACLAYDQDLLPGLEAATNFQQTTITIKAFDLEPNSDGYEVFLSGSQINPTDITRINNTPAGILNAFALKAKADGTLELEIVLRPSTPLGCHLLEIKSPTNYCAAKLSIYNNYLNRIVVNSLTNWSLDNNFVATDELLTINPPLTQAGYISTYSNYIQTFQVESLIYLSKVRLKFKAALTSSRVRLYLYDLGREGDLTQRTLLAVAETINVQADPNAALWTEFIFDQPIICKSERVYALGVESNDADVEIFVAESDQEDLLTNFTTINEVVGELYYSPDSINLELLRDEALTFALFRANFPTLDTQPAKEVNLDRYGSVDNLLNVTSFALNIRDVIPNYTNIVYEYRILNGLWEVFEPNQSICLDDNVNAIYLRAIVSSTDKHYSPVIPLLDSSVTLETNELSGTVISKLEEVVYYREVTILVDAVLPPTAQLTLYFNPSGLSTNWVPLTLDPLYSQTVDSRINLSRFRYTFQNFSDVGNKFAWKAELTTTDPSEMPLLKDLYIFLN